MGQLSNLGRRDFNKNEVLEQRLAIARIGYNEVIDATKHNDDKIGRALTSIAFFTTAGVAFAAGNGGLVLHTRFDMGGASIPLPSIFLITFFVFIVLTVIMYLSAMGNPLTLPSGKPHDGPRTDSNLFFFSIADQDLADWKENWGFDAKASYNNIRLRTINNFLEETHHLARRVKFKYERMEIARAILVTALISLALAIVTGLTPFLLRTTNSTMTTLDWSFQCRLYLAIAIALIELCLIFETFNNVLFKSQSNPKYSPIVKLHKPLLGFFPLFSVSLLMINGRGGFLVANMIWTLSAAVSTFIVITYARRIFNQPKVQPCHRYLIPACVGISTFIIPTVLVSRNWTEAANLILLILALLPVFVTQFNVLRETFRDWYPKHSETDKVQPS